MSEQEVGQLMAHEDWMARAQLGRRIRQLREEQGLTQRELAEGLTSTTHMSRIEAGQRHPGPAVLAGLAQRLEISVQDLAGLDDITINALRLADAAESWFNDPNPIAYARMSAAKDLYAASKVHPTDDEGTSA